MLCLGGMKEKDNLSCLITEHIRHTAKEYVLAMFVIMNMFLNV